MAIFYTGPRPVIRGRNSNDAVHTWKGTVGTYSNWDIFNTSQALEGAPNEHHTPGSGNHPHGLKMTRMYRGLESSNTYPVRNAGGGTRIDGMRYRPLENKAAGNNRVFKTVYGHANRVTSYSLIDHYDDSNRQTYLDDAGHAQRYVDGTGAAATFGTFSGLIYKGITTRPLYDSGQAIPDTYEYRNARVNEWQGVTSAKALGV